VRVGQRDYLASCWTSVPKTVPAKTASALPYPVQLYGNDDGILHWSMVVFFAVSEGRRVRWRHGKRLASAGFWCSPSELQAGMMRIGFTPTPAHALRSQVDNLWKLAAPQEKHRMSHPAIRWDFFCTREQGRRQFWDCLVMLRFGGWLGAWMRHG